MNSARFPAVELKDVEWGVAGKSILKSCSVKVGFGECVGVIGHNGAGKTTLFQILMGFKIPSRGDLFLNGVSSLNPKSRVGVAYVPERPYFNVEQTFMDFLSLHCALAGLTAGKKMYEIKRVSLEVGLQDHLVQKMKSFSKGMLQKASLAQAAIGDPSIMILDEPMSGLDPESREVLRTLIQSWKSSGKTILFSSHAIEDLEALANRVIALSAGEIRFDGSLEEWRSKR